MEITDYLCFGGKAGAAVQRNSQRNGEHYGAVLAATLKELIAAEIIYRKSYDEIPPRVEYSLTEKGQSVVPILQSICQWAGAFYKEDSKNTMLQCKKCDYR